MNGSQSVRRGHTAARVLGAVCIVIVGAVLLIPATTHAQFDVLLSPQLVSVELRPGSRSAFEFDLANQDRVDSVYVRLSLKDVEQGLQGEYRLSDTAMSYSCLEWLTLSDTLVGIAPSSGARMAVQVQVPPRAMGGAYGAVVFEIVQPQKQRQSEEGMPARFDYRFQLPSWIEIEVKRPQGSQRRLTAGELTVIPTSADPKLEKEFGDKGMAVTVGVENTGNVHVFTRGRMIIRDAANQLVKDTRLGAGRGLVLPGAATSLQTIMPLLRPGSYSLKAIVQYGGRSPAVAQTSFEVAARQVARMGPTSTATPLLVDLGPESLEQSVPAGGLRVSGINVMNEEDSAVTIEVALHQVIHGRDGQMWTIEGNPDSGRSCIPWLKIEPTQFTLEPRRRQNVRLQLQVPESASGGYYACVVLNARRAADTGGSALATPLYFPIYLTVPPDLKRDGEILNAKMEQGQGSSLMFKGEFRNTGNVHVQLRGSVRIQHWSEPGSVEGVAVLDTARFEDLMSLPIEADSVYVLPGGVRTVSSQAVTGLPAGRYRAQIAIQFGGTQPAIIEQEFVIKDGE